MPAAAQHRLARSVPLPRCGRLQAVGSRRASGLANTRRRRSWAAILCVGGAVRRHRCFSWLATAGSGDVLSGVADSLLSTRLDPLVAAALAAHEHARPGGGGATVAGWPGASALLDRMCRRRRLVRPVRYFRLRSVCWAHIRDTAEGLTTTATAWCPPHGADGRRIWGHRNTGLNTESDRLVAASIGTVG